MKVTQTITVEQRGIGKPDYSREIDHGLTRPGFKLQYQQSLVTFLVTYSSVASAYAWVKPPLAAGATDHLMDGVTGLDMPYSVSQGYTLTMISIGIACNQDLELWQLLRVSPIPIGQRSLCLAQLSGGQPFYVPEVVAFSSKYFDPTASLAFDYDIQVTNKGGAAMEGQIGVYMFLEKVGSPPWPTTKTVRCKWCGATREVPIETTNVICDKCGQLTIVYVSQKPRRT